MPKSTEYCRRVKSADGKSYFAATPKGVAMIEQLTADGVTLRNIAKTFGIDEVTLRAIRARQPEAEEAYHRGLAQEEEALVGNLRRAANEGNVLAAIFLLRARHQYQEKRAVDVNVNMGGVLVVPERESVESYLERMRSQGTLIEHEAGQRCAH